MSSFPKTPHGLFHLFLRHNSPARFDHARDFAGQGQLPEADAAQAELAQESTRAAAAETTVPVAALQLRRLRRLGYGEFFVSGDLGSSGHVFSYS
jgi:hypothetical protein